MIGRWADLAVANEVGKIESLKLTRLERVYFRAANL
jgi:hypothetical protein